MRTALLLTSSWRVGKLNITANLWQSIELVLQLESFIDTTTFNNGFESARVLCLDANDEVKEAKFSTRQLNFSGSVFVLRPCRALVSTVS